jgi:hypothetical protein
MTWDQRLTRAVHSAELDLRRATAQVKQYRRRVKGLREAIKMHRSGCQEGMKDWGEYSVRREKKRYLEHKRSRMAIRVKLRHHKNERRVNLRKEDKTYKKEERLAEKVDEYCIKDIVEEGDMEQDKMEADLREMEQELADVIELQQSAQSILTQKRDEALAGWAEEKATRIAMAEGTWYRYQE